MNYHLNRITHYHCVLTALEQDEEQIRRDYCAVFQGRDKALNTGMSPQLHVAVGEQQNASYPPSAKKTDIKAM